MANHSLNNRPDNPGSTASNLSLSNKQLRDMNRTALCGQIATGMVHDFNHVLSVIHGYNELLLGDPTQTDASREKLLQIRKAVDRGASLVQHVLTFSRGGSHAPVSLGRGPAT